MNKDSKHLKKQMNPRNTVGNLWLKYRESPIIYSGLLLILLILIVFIITNLIPGVRYGEYKGLKANEWLSFWGSLILPLLLLVIPTATYLLNQKEINRNAAAELRNEEWEKWVKLFEIKKDDPIAAYSLFKMHEAALKADNIQRSTAQHRFLYQGILGLPNDPENEQDLPDDLEQEQEQDSPNIPEQEASGNNLELKYQIDKSNQISNDSSPMIAFYDDMINSMSERGYSKGDIDIIISFYRKSNLIPYLQTSSIGNSTQIFSILYNQNKKRIGVMSVSSKSLYFKVGVGRKTFQKDEYENIINTNYQYSELKPDFNGKPAESEGYLREPIKFKKENLTDAKFFDATVSLMIDLCRKKFNK